MREPDKLLAHYNHETGAQQTLLEHSLAVAEYCKDEGETLEMPNIMYLVGLLHDVGKSCNRFQSHLINNDRKHVNHSSAGGKFILDYLETKDDKYRQEDQILKEILPYAIYSHHGLFDIVKFDEYMMEKRYKYDEDPQYNFKGEVLPFIEYLEDHLPDKLNLQDIYQLALKEFSIVYREKIATKINIADDHKNKVNALLFYLHVTIRLILSILKEGDIFDSANSVTEISVERISEEFRLQQWDIGLKHVEEKAEFFARKQDESLLNKARTRFSTTLKEEGLNRESGVYTLSMPTGSGKTQASLRYAINNARKYNKKHIFYITAFLSVLEQNAEDIRNTLKLDDKAILEHHSNIAEENSNNEEDEIASFYKAYIMDSWDTPVILTTMVQFFNTLFKGKSSNLRRFHQLANSVIIIDEVQSLSTENIYLFNLMINYLKNVMKANIILCTATQPTYDLKELDYRMEYSAGSDLVEISPEESKIFERVQAINLIQNRDQKMSSKELLAEIDRDLTDYNSVLIIMNTKKAVKSIYDLLSQQDDKEVYYLTTNLASAHRLHRIRMIKDSLDRRDQKVVVISTQLVEAGVDVDFDIVYRTTSGVDSLIQAAGRCNRNARLDKGLFKVFNYEEENTKVIEAIEKEKDATFAAMRAENIQHYGQVFDLESLRLRYYNKLFSTEAKNDLNMGYTFFVDNHNHVVQSKQKAKNTFSLVDILGANEYKRNIKTEYKRKLLMQDFDLASRAFSLIREKSESVIVHWTNQENPVESSEELIDELREAVNNYDAETVKTKLKTLQKFTISVYSIDKLDTYIERLDFFDQPIYILLTEYYDEQIGLNANELQLFSY